MSSSAHDPLTSSPPSAEASSSSHLPSSSNADFTAHDSALSLTDPTQDPSSIAIADPSDASHYDHDVDQHQQEEEHFFDDDDSAFGGSLIGCDTDTLASFITDYRYENGRRYHAYQDGEYWGANDESANELQDLAHHMYLMTLEGRLHLAPLEKPHNVLDLGTGTGIWAIEMADAYPSAHVIGTDLSPIQPLFVPPNLNFEIEDLNTPWTYPKAHFDFIHIRELFGCVADWTFFFSQVYSHLKPGGYVEILEHSVWPVSDDDTVNENSFFTLWGKTVVEMGEKFGKSFSIWEESKERLERAGFVDVTEVRYKWPMNGWPSPAHRTHGDDGGKDWRRLRELGVWNQLRLYDGVETFMLRLLTVAGGWSYERAQVYLAEMRKALKDTTVHGYLDVTVVYGRKPGSSSTELEAEVEDFEEIGFGNIETPAVMETASTSEVISEPTVTGMPTLSAHMEMDATSTIEPMPEHMAASTPAPVVGFKEIEVESTLEPIPGHIVASTPAHMMEPMEVEVASTTEYVPEHVAASTPVLMMEPMEIEVASTTGVMPPPPATLTPDLMREPILASAPAQTAKHTTPVDRDVESISKPTTDFTAESISVPAMPVEAEVAYRDELIEEPAAASTPAYTAPVDMDAASTTEPVAYLTTESAPAPATEDMAHFVAPITKPTESMVAPTAEVTKTPTAEPVLLKTTEVLP